MQKNKKILITGATGFLGANIARHFLKKGDKVYIFTRKYLISGEFEIY